MVLKFIIGLIIPKKNVIKNQQILFRKKHSKFQKRVSNTFKGKFTKEGNVDLEECLNSKNIKKKIKNNIQIERFQINKYFNKYNFYSKELSSLLYLDINKDTMIKIFKIVKRAEISLTKGKNVHLNKFCFKEKQNKLREILISTQKDLEKNGYNAEQLKTNIQNIYENYRNKPHFIIENQKYKDLSNKKRKLEKSIEVKKENLQKNCAHIKINIFNILIDQLKKKVNIEFLKPILKDYLNSKNKLEYNKVFNNAYYYELLKIIINQKNSLMLKKLS